jgi:hypothetical protein
VAGAPLPGRPMDQWSAEMQARGVAVFSQAECGAVMLSIREGELTARGYMNAQTFRSRAR